MMMIAGEVLVLGHCRPRGGRQSNYTNASVPPLFLQAELMQERKAGRQTVVTPFTERDATNKDRSVSLL